ncbi:MAG: RsiW-degrading membrane proteinase PrsW (M82 family) [Bacteroidia bacterium]|jgi:RsiW-degrading membrane proteinase PrsW (M82 family)
MPLQIIYGFLSLYICWIWVDYFRLIDVYERLSLKYLLPTFILGALSTVGLLFVYNILGIENFSQLNGDFSHDFRNCIINIGLVEEITKMIPFLVAILLFNKQLKEPIDYIIFASVAALGFAMVENYLYLNEHGGTIMIERAAMPTISHMFDTSLIAYGFIRYRFHPSKPHVLSIGLFVILAAVSHGIYDFWLMFPGSAEWHMEFVTPVYFLVTVSWFATILNNCTNNSGYFNYGMVIKSNKVANRLLLYYSLVLMAQLVFLGLKKGALMAVLMFFPYLIIYGITIGVICVRLSRFMLIKGRWFKLKLELPVIINFYGDQSHGYTRQRLRIRGEAYNEVEIAKYYHQYFEIKPLTYRRSQLGEEKTVFLEEKIFLKNDESFFVIRLNDTILHGTFKHYLLKYKRSGKTKTDDGRSIAGLMAVENVTQLSDTSLTIRDFKFIEWVTLTQSPESQRLSVTKKVLID